MDVILAVLGIIGAVITIIGVRETSARLAPGAVPAAHRPARPTSVQQS
jgi:hypothetical protein